ncbi:MAG: isochorismatase family protein [Rubrivivax sp.]|nr:isochorismatase family protein [Rubrivivax sp.]
MATIRPGHHSVLLVVDLQVGVLRDAWERTRILRNVARVVERARAAHVPVLWVQHADAEMPAGSIAWQWVPELAPWGEEHVVAKQFNSAFEQTSLEGELARLQATHIVLAGAASNWCVRATAHAALERGYDLTLVKDAHTTTTMAIGDGRRVEAADIVAELNVAMTWMSFPGRRNAVAPAAEVDFGTPHTPGAPDQR